MAANACNPPKMQVARNRRNIPEKATNLLLYAAFFLQ
jgi:hypothetical protein